MLLETTFLTVQMFSNVTFVRENLERESQTSPSQGCRLKTILLQ